MTDFRTGPWMQTACGGALPLIGVQARHIDWRDVARGLALTCRFAGQMRDCRVYSVAQHSVLVSEALEEHGAQAALYGLLHDAHEAYLGDWTSPLKQALAALEGGAEMRALEWTVAKAIHGVAGLAFPPPEPIAGMVKRADLAALATERRDLLSDLRAGVRAAGFDWQALPEPWPDRIRPIAPEFAEQRFLSVLAALLAAPQLDPGEQAGSEGGADGTLSGRVRPGARGQKDA